MKSIEVSGSAVTARVQGTQPAPYRVTIHVRPLTSEEWERAMAELASQARYSASLLAGEMPPDIEEAFHAAGVPLFPTAEGDLKTSCSCPDWANPCKHVAAVHYILGEQFDRDPFVLFELRGRSREKILAALRARRAVPTEEVVGAAAQGQAPEPEAPPLEECMDRFWTVGEDLSALLGPPGRGERVEGAMRIAGVPTFAREGEEILSTLLAAYQRVAKRARGLAYEGNGHESPRGSGPTSP